MLDFFEHEDPQRFLESVRFPERQISSDATDYCKSRVKMVDDLLAKSYLEAAFMQCLKEVENGCSLCNQVSDYQSRHLCPLFQHKLASFYRDGVFVPSNASIAHNWDCMAGKQGHKGALMQIAEDFISGVGCKVDKIKGVEILAKFADSGDSESAKRIVELASSSEIAPDMGSRYLLMLANSDADDSAYWKGRVAQCLANGELGLPKDDKLRELWEIKAAENGNVDIIESVARRYYDECNWQQSLRWYNRLQQEDTESDYADTVRHIFESYIQSENMTPQQMAEMGRKLYHGLDCEEDFYTAFLYYNESAKYGNAMGLNGLAECYTMGRGVSKDEQIGRDYRRRAADAEDVYALRWMYGHTEGEEKAEWKKKTLKALYYGVENNELRSMLFMAYSLYGGDVIGKDIEKMHSLAERILNLYNDPEAEYLIGLYYQDQRESVQAIDHFLQAAQRGVLLAQYKVGCYYYDGWNNTVAYNWSYVKAYEWFARAALRGHRDAQMKLYYYYKNGSGVDKNLNIANQWCLKAAEQGLPEAECVIAEAYYWGRGLEKDLSEARKWIMRATEHGERDAFFRAAYMESEGEGGPVNYEHAFLLYSELAESGGNAAMNNLACMYAAGQGTDRDYAMAAYWYEKAAESGDDVAQDNIGTYYLKGVGVDQDYEKARYWFEKASNNYYSKGTYNLARLYRYGKGVEVDKLKAIELYEKAISMPHYSTIERRGYDASIIELADLYYDGREIEQDYTKAFDLYKKAAEVNIEKAFLKLGYCYEYGYGVKKNIENAVFWYRKSAAVGNYSAKSRLEELGYDYIELDEDL